MKLFTQLFILFNLTICLRAQGPSMHSKGDISNIIDNGLIQVTQLIGVAELNQEKDIRELKVGDSFFETSYIETSKESFLKLILPDNSMLYMGPKSALKIIEIEGKDRDFETTIEVIKGSVRLVGYKGNHFIKSPKGVIYFKDADIRWDIYLVEKALVCEVTQYSGEIENRGEVVRVLSEKDRPEVNISSVDSVNAPWERWLGKRDNTHNYEIAYATNFNKKNRASRSIASIDEEKILDSDFILMSEQEKVEDDYSYPLIPKEIYVHENLFDEVVMETEEAAKKVSEKIVEASYKIAAKEIVWDVASRSLIRWGTQYAQEEALRAIPKDLENMYEEIEKRSKNLESSSEIYTDSVARISQLKSYTRAREVIKTKASAKAISEAQAYILSLTKEIITKPVEHRIYKLVKKSSLLATKNFMQSSELVYSEDVENLVEYLSQLAAQRFTKNEIDRIEKEVSYEVARVAVLEAAHRGSDKIASFISKKASKRTAELFKKMLEQEIGQRAARGLASENKIELSEKYRSDQQRRNFIR